MKIGALINKNNKVDFCVWAPRVNKISLEIMHPENRLIDLEKRDNGYYVMNDADLGAGTRYFYKLNDKVSRPDPASRYQPEGVHGPSQVVSHTGYKWNDVEWSGMPVEKYIIYEMHAGTFTKEGTFDAAGKKIEYLKDFGITAVEIMPVAQFPGERNWGYDGAYPFAVQNSYGGPDGLKKFIDLCHCSQLAVILDVVYNHFGPEGAYVNEFGYYFTHKYSTPWGNAINYDDAWSDGVRNYFIENALYWFNDYHIDALRLDAIHGIYDFGAKHILKEIAENTEKYSLQSGIQRYLIAESDLNDVRVISPFELNGFGLDAQWNDDFHHSMISFVSGERKSYYGDFGSIQHIEKTFRDGFVYDWKYSIDRKRYHGSSSAHISGKQLVVCLQNHDQVGNRVLGERISHLISFEPLKLIVGAMMISPYIPLLFMGEEFAAETPFMYFIHHSDKDLIDAVRRGRAKEFSELHGNITGSDPQDPAVFENCKLQWGNLQKKQNQCVYNYYKLLIKIKKDIPALSRLNKNDMEVCLNESQQVFIVERKFNESGITAIMNFSSESVKLTGCDNSITGKKIIDSSEEIWLGKGSGMPLYFEKHEMINLAPHQFVMYGNI